jgi:hypothetical protein
VWIRFEDCLNIERPRYINSKFCMWRPTNFGNIQIFCIIRLADHRKKPGTAIQCKTKDSSCHRQSSVRVLSGILKLSIMFLPALEWKKPTKIMCFAFSPLPLKSSLCQIIVIFNIFLHIYYNFCVVFCRPLFIILSYFVWPLHCLPFFDLWLPTTLLASTNFSCLLIYTRTAL